MARPARSAGGGRPRIRRHTRPRLPRRRAGRRRLPPPGGARSIADAPALLARAKGYAGSGQGADVARSRVMSGAAAMFLSTQLDSSAPGGRWLHPLGILVCRTPVQLSLSIEPSGPASPLTTSDILGFPMSVGRSAMNSDRQLGRAGGGCGRRRGIVGRAGCDSGFDDSGRREPAGSRPRSRSGEPTTVTEGESGAAAMAARRGELRLWSSARRLSRAALRSSSAKSGAAQMSRVTREIVNTMHDADPRSSQASAGLRP